MIDDATLLLRRGVYHGALRAEKLAGDWRGSSIPFLTLEVEVGSRLNWEEVVGGEAAISADQLRIRCVNECEADRLLVLLGERSK
jgi:hypothetical protein